MSSCPTRGWRVPALPRIAVLAAALVGILASPAAALTLTGFSPAGAPPNTWITLTGTEFTSVNAVRFNGTSASFSVINDTQLNAYVPNNATTGPISVSNAGTTAYSATNFFVGNAPSISNFSPTGGAAGTSVTINGSYFVGVTSVKFNNVNAAFTVNSSSQIVATVPAGAGTGSVTVTNPAGTTSSGTYWFPPTISNFSPAGGLPGTPITIHGTNFSIVNSVQFNGSWSNYSVQADDRLIAYVPAGATSGPLSVFSFAGSNSSATPFFVGPAPAVTQASPAGGSPGTSVTITGSDFVNVTAVTFNGAAALFSVLSPTQIIATVPGAATTGALSVSNPTGTGTWSTAFFVGSAPAVADFTPPSGPVGTAVTIMGSGFTGASAVRFAGVTAASFVVNHDGEIVATVPVGASTGPIDVVNPTGSGSSAETFAVTPQVLAATPMSVPASTAEGTQVDVFGHNFIGAWRVTFAGTMATFTVVDEGHLTTWVPPGATSGPIEVSTLVGAGTSSFSFQIVKFEAPPHSPYASWPMDLTVNLPLAASAINEWNPQTCADSTGGAYFAWQEYDAGEYRIRLQRITGFGEVAPGWPVTGLVIGTGPGQRQNPKLCADLVGGVYVTWEDARGSSSWDIFATRIGPDAVLAPGWIAGGTPVCTAPYEQTRPALIADASSGVFIAWQDNRTAGNWDIFVQRVLANGAVPAGWDAQGLGLTFYGYHEYSPAICGDGSGGAYVCWRDDRSFPALQRVLSSGLVASGWPANGLQAGSSDFYESNAPASLFADGSGNVVLLWSGYYPYAMKWQSDASRAPGWPTWGRILNNQQTSVGHITGAPDLKGGLFAAWESNSAYALVAQRLTSSGAVAPGWPSVGYTFRNEVNQSINPVMVQDGAGGAIVTWQDQRIGTYDLYAQRFLPTNTSQPAWSANGVLVSAADGNQWAQAVTPVGRSGVVVVWNDGRAGSSIDIYAQNLTLAGKPGNLEPHIVSVRDVAGDQGGKVRITWQRSPLDTMPTLEIATYGVWRRVSAAYAQSRLRAEGTARLTAAGDDVTPGTLRTTRANAEDTWWEGLASIPARGQTTYSFVAATLADSGTAGHADETYMVDAHASFGSYFWSSDADSGHSADNLPPAAPLAFTAAFQPGSTWLHWRRNSENDLAEYRVYRGLSAGFEPAPDNLVGATTDTSLTDPHAGYAYYKLVAVDVHENTSVASLALPPAELDAPNPMPTEFAVSAPAPNPAGRSCLLSLALPRASAVKAAVYDAAGRRVRDLAAAAWPAGTHALQWDLRDEAGAEVAGGLYFIRVEAGGLAWTKRVAVLH